MGIKKTVVLGMTAVLMAGGLGTLTTAPATAAGHVTPAASQVGGEISRTEVITRAKYWYDHRNEFDYNGGKTFPDPDKHRYRTDCSGFVSMALHITPTGLGAPSTVNLPTYGVKLKSRKDMKMGDFTGRLGPGTGGDAGHVRLFEKWVNKAAGTYMAYDFGAAPLRHHTYQLSTDVGRDGVTYVSYQYKKIKGGETPPPAKKETALAYTGPKSLTNGSAAKLSGKLTDAAGKAVAGRSVKFTLGNGSSGQDCTGKTNTAGQASCTVDPVKQTGESVTVTAAFAGDTTYAASKATATVKLKKDTKLTYTGDTSISNGSAARLSAKLADTGGKAVSGRPVDFTLGSAQTCTGTTDAAGSASCTVDDVRQTLNDDATVPVTASFAGDGAYNASKTASTVKLQYATGRSFGLSADVPLLGLPISIKPTPDTGEVKTAGAAENAPPCAQNVGALLVSAGTLCGKVTTKTGPMSVTSTASVAEANVGLAGLPVIGLSGVKSTATGTCTATTGGVDLDLTVAGIPVHVGDTPNLDVDLGVLGVKLVVDEQIRNADGGLTVNAAHLTGPGGINVVIASSTAAVHNCG